MFDMFKCIKSTKTDQLKKLSETKHPISFNTT